MVVRWVTCWGVDRGWGVKALDFMVVKCADRAKSNEDHLNVGATFTGVGSS